MESSRDVVTPIFTDIENVLESRAPEDIISKQIESVFMKKFAKEYSGEESIETDLVKLSNLPDTVLLKIFSNFSLPELCHVALVCKHWLWVVYDSELWRYVNLSEYSKLTEGNIINLIKARLSPLLKTLDLSNREITPVIINELTQHCHQLDTLVLQNCLLPAATESSLNLNSIPEKLVRLDIRSFKKGFHFVHLILESSDLSQLECFGFGNNHFCPAFTDFQLIFRKMHALRILECVDCDTVNDAQLRVLADELQCLESLVLKKCKNITGSSLPYLINNAKHLKSLNLSDTNIDDLALTLTSWEKSVIEELDLSFCTHLTAEALTNSISKIKSLQYIALNNVGKSKAVTPELFKKVFEQQTWKKLEVFCLRFCNRFSSEALPFIQHCSKLRHVSLRTCHKVSYASIASALKNFPNLVTLECGSLRMSESSVCSQWIEIFVNCSKYCKNLEKLVLLKCSDIPLSKVSQYRAIMQTFMETCVNLDTICMLYSEEAILLSLKETALLANRGSSICITDTPVCAIIPPFRHSLDTELNRQRFKTFLF